MYNTLTIISQVRKSNWNIKNNNYKFVTISNKTFKIYAATKKIKCIDGTCDQNDRGAKPNGFILLCSWDTLYYLPLLNSLKFQQAGLNFSYISKNYKNK